MVSTRHHPSDFATPSPTRTSPRKSSRVRRTASPIEDNFSASPSLTPETKLSARQVAVAVEVPVDESSRAGATSKRGTTMNGSSSASTLSGWTHSASNITFAWICISLPLTIWDTLYVMLRPHTFPGGKLQWPIWKPYEIYAAVDHLYGVEGWNRNDGFAGAQGMLNAVECVLYGLYLMIVWNHGRESKGGSGVEVHGDHGVKQWLSGGKRVYGRAGNRAVLIGFAAAVMTLSKTVLYILNEYFSDFENIKHNDWPTLFAVYIMMIGCWILFSAYMTITFGSDIIAGLDLIALDDPLTLKKEY